MGYKPAAVIVLMCVLAGFIYFTLSWKSETQKAGETVIRQAAAQMLNKNPEDLASTDFNMITQLFLKDEKLSDIRLLKKFTNLKNLQIVSVYTGQPASLPKWLLVLEKLHLYKKPEKAYADVSILKKLPNLETLTLAGPIVDFKAIKKLKNLKELNIENITGLDIESIKELKQLQKLGLNNVFTPSLEPIGKLSNLQELRIMNMSVVPAQLKSLNELVNLKSLTLQRVSGENSVFENLGKLKNLQELTIEYSVVSYGYGPSPVNLRPLKELTNLRKLKIRNIPYGGYAMYNYPNGYHTGPNGYPTGFMGYGYSSLSYDILIQLEELQKALTDLEIER